MTLKFGCHRYPLQLNCRDCLHLQKQQGKEIVEDVASWVDLTCPPIKIELLLFCFHFTNPKNSNKNPKDKKSKLEAEEKKSEYIHTTAVCYVRRLEKVGVYTVDVEVEVEYSK